MAETVVISEKRRKGRDEAALDFGNVSCAHISRGKKSGRASVGYSEQDGKWVLSSAKSEPCKRRESRDSVKASLLSGRKRDQGEG